VFGVAGSPPQYLPAWGANPRRKDMFVEVDWQESAFGTMAPLQPEHAHAVAAHFAAGNPWAVLNPNGEPGIAVHFDMGWSPGNVEDAMVFGACCGANPVRDPKSNDDEDIWKFRDEYMTSIRHGVFRHAVALGGCCGKSRNTPGNQIWFGNLSGNPTQVLAHELGHTAGLWHAGHPTWGDYNCKPHYRSMMNYAYQGAEGMPFSDGTYASIVLNPAEAVEDIGPGLEWLDQGPFFFSTSSSGVDWNRDGVLQGFDVRAAVTSASDTGCDTFTAMFQKLREGGVSVSTPSIVRLRNNLYVFWTDYPSGAIRYKRGVIGPVSKGSCQNDEPGTTCMTWSSTLTVPASDPAFFVTAANFNDGGIALAYVKFDGAIRVAHSVGVNSSGVISSWSTDIPTPSGAATLVEPEIAFINNGINGGAGALYIFYAATDGTYQALSSNAPGSSWSGPFALFDDSLQPLTGNKPPSVAALPTGGVYDQYCATFVSSQDAVRLYCVPDGTLPVFWVDRSAAFSSTQQSGVKAGLAFHVNRTPTGAFIGGDPTNGYLHVIVNAHNVPRSVLLRRLPGAANPPEFVQEHSLYFGNKWMEAGPLTSIDLYDDPVLGATKAAFFNSAEEVFFYPFADGTPRRELRDGNDFTVMERNTCIGVHSGFTNVEAVCGGPSTSVWGY
jgi:hypothetical protein